MKKHYFVIALGFGIVAILLLYSVLKTVRSQEKALVVSFGKIVKVEEEPGLKFVMPWQKLVKFDTRIRTLEQQLEQTQTRDKQNVIVSVYVNWRVSDPVQFRNRFFVAGQYETAEDIVFNAEDTIRKSWIADAKNIITEYNFNELITTNPDKFKLPELEKGTGDKIGGMLGRMIEKTSQENGYGIKIADVGIRRLGIPDQVTESVFNRMRADREAVVVTRTSEGKKIADETLGNAKSQATIINAEAVSKARQIEAEGDAEAAQYYAKFLEHPQLANFLRKLETLRKTLSKRTTLVLDKNSAPYSLIQDGPELPKD